MKQKTKKDLEFKCDYKDKMLEYFDIPANFLEKIETSTKKDYKEFASNLPTIQGFCAKIKIDRDTFFRWLKEAEDEGYKEKDKKDKIEFLHIYKRCREIQEQIWLENSLKGLYSNTFATFVGKNIFWWKDKSLEVKAIKGQNNETKKEFYDKIRQKVDEMNSLEIDSVLMEILG